MNINRQKKAAVINDLSGYGRCSLTVAIPILSAMKVQCCPVPTSILSNHTGFSSWFFDDYTDNMVPYLEEWKKLKLHFDGIASGFLGSLEQIQIVADMITYFKKKDTIVIIDPIMGDHGKAYKTYTSAMCQEMKKLAGCGDVVTPNITEACILTDLEYKKEGWKREELKEMALAIQGLGAKAVIITGVSEGEYLTNVVAEPGHTVIFQRTRKVGTERPGTGDVFSSVVTGYLVKGQGLETAAKKAAVFVRECIKKSEELGVPAENGVCFEELLSHVMR